MDLKTLKDTPPWDWPEDAGKMILEILVNLTGSHDEDITEAIYDALSMAEGSSEDEDYNEDDDLLH